MHYRPASCEPVTDVLSALSTNNEENVVKEIYHPGISGRPHLNMHMTTGLLKAFGEITCL